MHWWPLKKRDADLQRELQADLELEEEEQRERGLSRYDAHYAARRAFGNPALIREQTRAVWSWNWLESLISDVRYSLRSLSRTPLLTFIVVLALSVGLGLNAGIFSILNAMFLESPTRTNRATFVQIYPRYEGWFAGAAKASTFNAQDFDAIRTETRTLSELAAWERISVTLNDLNRQETSLLATCNYFQVFGINQIMMGRVFRPEECQLGAETRVVVLSEHAWKNLYASNAHMIGNSIHINGQAFVVIGIVADSSSNPTPGGIWIPYTLQPAFDHGNSAFQNPNWPWLSVAARLRPGFTRADALAEMEIILRQRDRFYIEQRAFPLERKTQVVLTDGSFIENPALGSVAAGLMALVMGPPLLVLLLACTNVTMLFLSRSIARRGEIAVRLAMGAGRARLMRLLAIESFALALIAGVVSVVLAIRVPSLIFASVDPEEQIASAIHPDWKVFGYLAAMVLASALVSSIAPARESFRFDLVTALKGREGSVTARTATTSVLIVVQLAMSFVLLTAAVLFAKLPSTVEGIDPGFETHHLMTVPLEINLPPYTKSSALVFYRSLETRIAEIPGVQSLAYASVAPFSLAQLQEIRLDKQSKGQGRAAVIDTVSANYFSTFGIPLLHGRSFLKSDVSASGNARVAIVSRQFARALWGNDDPVGKVVVTPDGAQLAVVGVAADTRSERFGIMDGPRIYTVRDPDSIGGQVFVRFAGDAEPVAKAIEQAVKTLDPTQANAPSTIWEFLETNATAVRALARIVLFMAGIAVVLAITGVYAVLTFAINRRSREFAIQMMLGATRESIFKSVLAKGIRQIAIGLLFGLVLAIPAAWTFANMTKQSTLPIQAFDISMYFISAILLLMVSVCAMTLPGLRATRIDPMQALRGE